jgi:PKD repeat protein
MKKHWFFGAVVLVFALFVACPPSVLKAEFTYMPLTPVEGQTVVFQAYIQSSITSYDWQFGDGKVGLGSTVYHAYASAGNFPVGLEVTGQSGTTRVATKIITIRPKAVAIISFTSATRPDETGVDVTFTDASTGPVMSWLWNFGDGTTSTQKNPPVHFFPVGLYAVTLTVSDGVNESMFTANIKVGPPLKAAFDYAPANPVENQVIQFFDRSTSGLPIVSWRWSFGDGSADVLTQNASHVYVAAGTYEVTLTVTDSDGLQAKAVMKMKR